MPESMISTSRKVTVIQVTSNLNSETAITIRIDPSDSTADISGPPQDRQEEQVQPDPGQRREREMESLMLGREQSAERDEMNERQRAKTDALRTVEGGKRREAAGDAGKTRNRHGQRVPLPGRFLDRGQRAMSSNCNTAVMTRTFRARQSAQNQGFSEWGLIPGHRPAATPEAAGSVPRPRLELLRPRLGHVEQAARGQGRRAIEPSLKP